MNSTTSPQVHDYYGHPSTTDPSPSVKQIRKMKRTELSTQKKYNTSAKSISTQKQSHFSNNLKSIKPTINPTIILKNDIASTLKNSQSKYGQNNLPSSTDLQNATNASIRKSRLKISTGVIGIKMDSISPTTIVSHPSKVLIVNESSSGKKGSKNKKQKSILYVEYNNFMTELNNNKLSKNSETQDERNSHKNTHVQSANNQQILSPQNKKQQFQQFSNLLPNNFDNEYFAGMSRNCISPMMGMVDRKDINRKTEKRGFLGCLNNSSNIRPNDVRGIQSPRKQGSKLKLSRGDAPTIQSPKNETSIANLSITSTTKNKLQSPRLGSVSPRMFKIQHSGQESKLNRTKISMHDLAALKQKNNQQNGKNYSKIRDSRDSVRSSKSAKKQSYGIQVNIAENLFPKDIKIMPLTHNQSTNMNQQYFHKLKTQENHPSQKSIHTNNLPTLKQYKTQNQLSLSRGKKQIKAQSQKDVNLPTNNSGFQNPYNLAKNQNLVNNYQKKKNQSPFNDLVNEIKGKSIKNQPNYSPIVQFNLKDSKHMQSNFCSDGQDSVISQTSSKRGRKLMKISGSDNLHGSSKISMKSYSKSKLNIPPSPKASKQLKFQPKTPQPYSKYNDSSSQNQGQRSNHNQEQLSPQKFTNQNHNYPINNNFQTKVHKLNNQMNQDKIKHMEEYNSAYYTPNPYSLTNSKRNQNQLNFVPEDRDKNQLISELSPQNSGSSSQELQSQVSSMQSIEDNLSIKSGKLSNVSEARLKRQQIASKSKIRSSRNSLKSNQGGSSKKLKLNPVSRLDSSLGNSIVSDVSQNNESYTVSKKEIVVNERKGQQILEEQVTKNQQRVRSTTYGGVKFLKVTKNQGQQKQSMFKSSVIRKEQQQKVNSNILTIKKSEVKPSYMIQKPSIYEKKSEMASQMRQQSNMIHSKQKVNNYYEPKSVYQTNHHLKVLNHNEQLKSPGKSQDLSPKQNVSTFERKETTLVKESSIGRSNYKKQLEVENVESQIEQMTESDIRNNYDQVVNTPKSQPKQSMMGKEQNRHSQYFESEQSSLQQQPKTPQPNKIRRLQQSKASSLQKSSYSMQSSLQRSTKRQPIRKSIHLSNLQPPQMTTSRHARSSVSIKSGRNLKPLNLQNPTVEEFLAYVEQYDIAIGFLGLYVENTVTFYCGEDNDEVLPQVLQFRNRVKNAKAKKYQEKYEKIAFLMMKKYLYEKNRIIKCLRGIQGNIFNLTGLEIPQKILRKFINHKQTKQKVKEFEVETKELFKEMEQKFRSLRLKPENKKDKLIKLETPYDDFTRYIVAMLMEELNQITSEIDELQVQTGSKLSSSNPSLPLGTRSPGPKSLTSVIAQQILTNEQRGIEVMEMVFLLSQLQGRKVKKLQLLNLSEMDFQVFYENYIDKLLVTYEYFQGLKYPSDKVIGGNKAKQ